MFLGIDRNVLYLDWSCDYMSVYLLKLINCMFKIGYFIFCKLYHNKVDFPKK